VTFTSRVGSAADAATVALADAQFVRCPGCGRLKDPIHRPEDRHHIECCTAVALLRIDLLGG